MRSSAADGVGRRRGDRPTAPELSELSGSSAAGTSVAEPSEDDAGELID